MMTPPKQPVTGWQRDLVISIDRGIYWFSKHWLAVFNAVIALYVGLPMLAPALMYAGASGPANVIYTLYKPMCHQMASRSFFLFGEQYAYPRALAGTELRPLESYMDDLPEFEGVEADNWVTFLLAARSFVGNEQLGYKMALCERDIAIYGFVLVGGLMYALLRLRFRVRPLPFLLFLLIGIGPIALDGFSQLFSYYGAPIPGLATDGFGAQLQAWLRSVFPLRESTPMLRTLTGALFGLTLAWLAYPNIDAGMRGTEQDLAQKLRRVEEGRVKEEE
ncbi:MAG: DUF2085 domain-containing protein [Anaerolinea sp.]|nr:DUF2085 domain-containing protein [Anaerolinea sp.]